MKVISAPAEFVANAEGERPAKSLFWACINDKEGVFLSVVKNCSKAELMPILQGRIVEGSDVYTDGWKAYDGLVTNGYQHHRVHHHENEFARGKNHVNGIESFWSYAKFRMAKLRGVRKEKFLIHLKESEWRFNHRSDNIYSILLTQTRHFPL